MEVFEKEKHPERIMGRMIRDGKIWLWVSAGSVFIVYGLLKAFGLNPDGCKQGREEKAQREVQ